MMIELKFWGELSLKLCPVFSMHCHIRGLEQTKSNEQTHQLVHLVEPYKEKCNKWIDRVCGMWPVLVDMICVKQECILQTEVKQQITQSCLERWCI